MQPPVLMNRFIINLKSLNTPTSSQGSSAQHQWSRLPTSNFHIPDSFLGNIGEDLQDGHESTDNDPDGHHETDTVCLSIEGLPGADSEATSTAPGSSTSRPMNAQVSLQIR